MEYAEKITMKFSTVLSPGDYSLLVIPVWSSEAANYETKIAINGPY
jgi:hypothetical protein